MGHEFVTRQLHGGTASRVIPNSTHRRHKPSAGCSAPLRLCARNRRDHQRKEKIFLPVSLLATALLRALPRAGHLRAFVPCACGDRGGRRGLVQCSRLSGTAPHGQRVEKRSAEVDLAVWSDQVGRSAEVDVQTRRARARARERERDPGTLQLVTARKFWLFPFIII